MKKALILGGLSVLFGGCLAAKDFRCRFVWVDDRTHKVLKTPKPSQWQTGTAACFVMMDRLVVEGPLVTGPRDMGLQVDGTKKQKEKFNQDVKKRIEDKKDLKGVSWTGWWK